MSSIFWQLSANSIFSALVSPNFFACEFLWSRFITFISHTKDQAFEQNRPHSRKKITGWFAAGMMYLHLNLMQEMDIWVEPPKSIRGTGCRHHWSWWRGTILWSLGLAQENISFVFIGDRGDCPLSLSLTMVFMFIYGGDCGHQFSAIDLHCLCVYLALLHYMVCWWFQRHITHWLYWRLCNVEQNFCSPLPFLS
jgi:hypothetical protein